MTDRRSPEPRERQLVHPLLARATARRLPRRRFLGGLGAAALAGVLTACTGGGDSSDETPTTEAAGGGTTTSGSSGATEQSSVVDDIARPAGWTEVTHGRDVAPDYDVVFPKDRVNQLAIRVTAQQWDEMLANMTELFGERGTGGPGGVFPGGVDGGQFQPPNGGQLPEGFQPPNGGQLPEGFQPPNGGQLPEGFQPPNGGQLPDGGQPDIQQGPGGFRGGPGFGGGENPMWVAATIEFDGKTWTNVGVRFKGNSSLSSAWGSGTDKLPLKFDFDEFEDDFPEIDNQRFYGFKQLSLSNNFNDATEGMRETIAYELLDAAGLPAARTASYEIILDRGEGPTSLGLYTVIEVPDDTGIERYFGTDDGNIYEGDGNAASLALGVRDQIPDSFEKENNEGETDWSDVEALYDVLHSDRRTANPEAWRSDLETIFDVDGFLEWLGIAAAIQHWDTYGGMSHNFFLYHDPESDRLVWISWDHNLVLGASGGPGDDGRGFGDAPGGGFGGRGGPGGFGSTSLDRSDVSEQWPLIRFLLDDPVYAQRYLDHLAESRDDVLVAATLEARVEQLRALLAPHAADGFDAAADALIASIDAQAEALGDFLA